MNMPHVQFFDYFLIAMLLPIPLILWGVAFMIIKEIREEFKREKL